MNQTAMAVTLSLSGDDLSDLDSATRRLRSELLELDIDSASLVEQAGLPGGAKGAGAVEIGQLMLALAPVVLPKVIELVQVWTQRNANQKVKLKSAVGDRVLEVEFPPGGIKSEELNKILREVNSHPQA